MFAEEQNKPLWRNLPSCSRFIAQYNSRFIAPYNSAESPPQRATLTAADQSRAS